MRLTRISFRSLLLCVASLLVPSLACAQAASVVGIVEGGATLIRQTTRYALAEGVALNEQDIIETAPGAFAQIELPGGVLVGIGESTRLMLRPRVGKGLTPPPLYLLQGWLKTSTSGAFGYASPSLRDRDASRHHRRLHHGRAVRGVPRKRRRQADAARWRARPSRNWPAATSHKGVKAPHRRSRGAPRPSSWPRCRASSATRLPARGEQFAKRNVAPKALGEIAYTDVAAWLRTEPALRLPLLPLWRSRAADLTFRAAAKANLAQHPEWEPYADPEGYARRMAEEAERRRAREAARQAAAAAAAAAASGTAVGGGKP